MSYISNISFGILNYMASSGYISNKENKMELITNNKDYRIEINRKDYNSLFDSNINYICSINFFDNITNVNIINLEFSELEAFKLIDNLFSFIEFNSKDLVIPLSLYNNQFSIVNIQLSRLIDNNFIEFIITNYNQNIGIVNPIIRISFDDVSFSKFIDLLYFDFLIDIIDDPIGEFSVPYNDINME